MWEKLHTSHISSPFMFKWSVLLPVCTPGRWLAVCLSLWSLPEQRSFWSGAENLKQHHMQSRCLNVFSNLSVKVSSNGCSLVSTWSAAPILKTCAKTCTCFRIFSTQRAAQTFVLSLISQSVSSSYFLQLERLARQQRVAQGVECFHWLNVESVWLTRPVCLNPVRAGV